MSEDEKSPAAKVIEAAFEAFMSGRQIRPAVVHPRANEAKEDYLSEIPGELYRLMRDDIASVWSLLESPIEQVAIFYLASENYGRADWPIYAKVARQRGLFDHKNYPVQIIPQVEFGRYRVDFLVDLGFRGLVAIECDGAEYHQDAKKDFARDQELWEKHSVKVFRIAGKDIWRDNAMTSMWAEMIRLYLKWGSTR
jgi:very-short-patch-repair endonuclease